MLNCYCQGGETLTLLKQYRLKNKISQKEMANKLNINVYTYINYELGRRRIPYNILANFLEIRGYEDDLKLAKILKGIE